MPDITESTRSAFSGPHCTHVCARPDAVIHNGREYVPTIYGRSPEENTVWVTTWSQFFACGGRRCFNEDQTEITLILPERHKFSCAFECDAALAATEG